MNDELVARSWAWSVGETKTAHQIRWDSMNELRKEAGSNMVYHKINFCDFVGIILTGEDITELLPSFQKELATALVNAYVVSPTAEKGCGMFASRDIPAASVILVEKPIIICPTDASLDLHFSTQETFNLLFDGLHPDIRAKALSLYNSNPLRPYAEGIVRTNAFGLPLEKSESNPTGSMTHRGIFLDLSRCNHRQKYSAFVSHYMLISLFSVALPTAPIYGTKPLALAASLPIDL